MKVLFSNVETETAHNSHTRALETLQVIGIQNYTRLERYLFKGDLNRNKSFQMDLTANVRLSKQLTGEKI